MKIESSGTFNDQGTKGSWSLIADTLQFKYDTKGSDASYKIVLKDGRLALWDWPMWDANRRDEQCAARVLERFDPSKPLAAPPPRRVTVRPEDLVGTWAGAIEAKQWGTVVDTLIIGADYTLRAVHVGPFDDAHEKGTWALLPGDVLKGPLGNTGQIAIYLHNGELMRCSPNYAVLKRVAP